MTGRRFIPTGGTWDPALNTIPYHRQFMIKCKSCGVEREVAREYLAKASPYLSLQEMAPRFRCVVCREKNAEIQSGEWVS